ncbi:MAG: GTP-binding protein [Planctomycetota bacterium]|jgi:signal recognition particle receptor subunit beta
MVQINFAAREVNCKIVYYGPGRSGKTTNLEVVHAKAPPANRGDLVSIATETDRTLYFDFLPLELGQIANMNTKFQLYTVPGQVFYNATRKLVLQGSDGIIFVADSNPDMRDENIESLENLAENLAETGLDIDNIPIVFQWNKRDLPNAMPPEQMNADLNRWNAPTCDGIAVKGEGVFPTLQKLSSLVMKKLNSEYSDKKAGAQAPAAQAPAAAAPAAPPPRPAAPPPRPAAPPPPRAAAAPPRPSPRPGTMPPPPRAIPRAPTAVPGRGAPPPRRPNPLAEEIRRRKQMEARRVQTAPPPQARPARGRRRPGSVSPVVIAAVVLALVGIVVVFLKFGLNAF